MGWGKGDDLVSLAGASIICIRSRIAVVYLVNVPKRCTLFRTGNVCVHHIAVVLGTHDIGRYCLQPQPFRLRLKALRSVRMATRHSISGVVEGNPRECRRDERDTLRRNNSHVDHDR